MNVKQYFYSNGGDNLSVNASKICFVNLKIKAVLKSEMKKLHRYLHGGEKIVWNFTNLSKLPLSLCVWSRKKKGLPPFPIVIFFLKV